MGLLFPSRSKARRRTEPKFIAAPAPSSSFGSLRHRLRNTVGKYRQVAAAIARPLSRSPWWTIDTGTSDTRLKRESPLLFSCRIKLLTNIWYLTFHPNFFFVCVGRGIFGSHKKLFRYHKSIVRYWVSETGIESNNKIRFNSISE